MGTLDLSKGGHSFARLRYMLIYYYTHAVILGSDVASNDAEEAVTSSLFCIRVHAHIGDVL